MEWLGGRPPLLGSPFFFLASALHRFPFAIIIIPLVMATKSQQPKGRDGTLSSLNVAIEALNLAKEASSITPAKAVFGSVSILLTMIRVRSLSPDDEMFQVDT